MIPKPFKPATDLIKDWSSEERAALAAHAPQQALDTRFRHYSVRDLASEILQIARTGLKNRNFTNPFNLDETHYLDVLFGIVSSGITPAQELINRYQTVWNRKVDPLFSEYAY